MNDFYEQMGYELPPDMPNAVKEDKKEYYRHPGGIYHGFIGKIMLKYKTSDGKKVEAGTPGANLSHGILQIWITKYLGTAHASVNVEIIKPDLTFDKRPVAELYYPQLITFLPKEQWKNVKLFDKFTLGTNESKVIRPNVDKPTIKETVFKNFAYYYGVPVKFEILISDKGNTYINSAIEIIEGAKRFSQQDMIALEREFERLLEAERESRKNQEQQYTPPTADIDLSDVNGEMFDGTDSPF